jgi:acetylornithine deacetylase/succinyl-diaminopimelate desuccinylase-like protein
VAYTTLHVGIISGGETINIVPNRASFDFEIRYLPGDDVDEMFRRIEAAADEIAQAARARFAGAQLVFEPLAGYPALDTGPDDEIVTFVKSLARANATTKISFGTEGGLVPAAPGRALGGVRAGRHRGCPQARRVCRGEPAGRLFGLPVTARRCLERMSWLGLRL